MPLRGYTLKFLEICGLIKNVLKVLTMYLNYHIPNYKSFRTMHVYNQGSFAYFAIFTKPTVFLYEYESHKAAARHLHNNFKIFVQFLNGGSSYYNKQFLYRRLGIQSIQDCLSRKRFQIFVQNINSNKNI